MAGCEVCRAATAPIGRWSRRAPATGHLDVCAECAKRFTGWSNDRASDYLDQLRLIGLAQRLGGEVWESDGRSFWYREPLVSEATVLFEAPPPPAPSPATGFLYTLAGRPVERGPAAALSRSLIEMARPVVRSLLDPLPT